MSAVNLTALRTEVAPPWVEDPAGRGTWSLLYSCSFTLGICVWTSIHLNVPPIESSWKSWRRKLKWLFIALFAPEIVVFTAFQQWLTAKLFLKELIKISDSNTSKDLEGGEGHQRKRKFDMTYAFYATMGGFAVDIEHLHNTVKQGTLTTKGLLFLADQGHFFEVSAESISDKSKANLLAKVLVCLQVLWAAGQTIERKIADYPISLLEFHTLVHVVCALVMYILWLQKPYDVGHPTILSSDIDECTLAFIVASSCWRGRSGFLKSGSEAKWIDRLLAIWLREDPEFVYYGKIEQSPRIYRLKTDSKYTRLDNMDDQRLKNHILFTDGFRSQSTVDPEKTYYADFDSGDDYTVPDGVKSNLCLLSGQALCSGFGPPASVSPHSRGCRVKLSEKDITRLDLAAAFIDEYLLPTSGSRGSNQLTSLERSYPVDQQFNPFENSLWNPHGRRLICHREENFIWESGAVLEKVDNSGRNLEPGLLGLAMLLIPAAYGRIHLSALWEMFPTLLESMLWKASCFTIIGFAVFLILWITALVVATQCRDKVDELFRKPMWSQSTWTASAAKRYERISQGFGLIILLAAMCALLIAVPLYTGARVFLVLESFISLRHVPIGLYTSPPSNFMSYVPHL